MVPSVSEIAITELSIPQRLDLISRLWDSIPDNMAALPIPDSHCEELERRLLAANAAPDAAIPWDQVRDEMRAAP